MDNERPGQRSDPDQRRGKPGPSGQSARKGKRTGPSAPVWPTLRRLLRYMKPHAGVLAGVVVALLATTVAELAPPWIIRRSIDRYILGGQPDRIGWAAAGLLALSVAQGGIDFVRLYLAARIGQRIVFGLRSAIFEHLSRLSFSFYDQARTGDLMSRVTADIDVLSDFFGRAAVIVSTNILTLVGILVVLTIWDWRLGMYYLCLIPPIVYGMWTYARRVRPAIGRVRRKLADLTAAAQESLVGILVVKLFGREAFEEKRVDRQSRAFLQANIETSRITSL